MARHETKLYVRECATTGPSWDALFAVAEAQQGVFAVDQATEAGFSSQLLNRHLHSGNIVRIRRGVYRLARFPAAERAQEDLVVAWLWSERAGVLSHETALQLHGLSDALPGVIHLTVPISWEKRRVRAPDGVRLYHADTEATETTWIGSVPVTSPARSIRDVAAADGDASVVDAAIRQALRRDLASLPDLAPAVSWLAGEPARDSPDGTWVLETVSGICSLPLDPDWRSLAAALAARHEARLHAARYRPESRQLYLELAWPDSDSRPDRKPILEDAKRTFSWL